MTRLPERLSALAGDTIYHRGETADRAYLILRGAVELRVDREDGEPCVALRGPGEVFGDLALVDDSPRISDAVATEPTELLAIESAHVSERVAVADPLLRLFIGAIVTRYSESAATSRGCQVGMGQPAAVLRNWAVHASEACDTLSFEHQLRAGIQRGELDLFFQPIVQLAGGQLAGFEALVRWQHPDRGLLLPGAFIPAAEASGVICDITDFCIRQVGAHLPVIHATASSRRGVSPRPFVSVNVTAADLARPAFAALTVSALCDASIDPESVQLEVTESILMQDAERCARTLQNLRDQGMAVAIDDFGTGYSSLHYLNALPLSALKIDQSFCRSLLSDGGGRKIMGAILQLGRELGLSVTAEGVENAAQRQVLQSMGCEFGQGYLFGPPRSLDDTLDLIARWDGTASATSSAA